MPTYRDPEGIERQQLFEIANPTGKGVLEVGCGDGRMTRLYADDAAFVIGVDPNLAGLQPTPNTLVMQAHAEYLPFAKKSFDLAIFSWSL